MYTQSNIDKIHNASNKKMSLILKDPSQHQLSGVNHVLKGHFEPWTLEEPVTPTERAVATSMSSINEMFQVPTDVPDIGQTVYFLMLWSSPSTVLRVFVQNQNDNQMYFYKAIEGSNPPVDLGTYQSSQLSAGSICIKGGVTGLNTTFLAGQIVAAQLTQVPPNFNTLTTTQIQAWKRVQQTRPISEQIIDGVRFNSPLLTSPEYVSRFVTQQGQNLGFVPSLITEKSSQQQIYSLRENPDFFPTPTAANNYTIFQITKEQLAQFTIQQGVYKIDMHFCYRSSNQPTNFTVTSNMNYVAPNNQFANALSLVLPDPNWVSDSTYAWSIDTLTYEAVSNQGIINIAVQADNFSLASGMVKITSISSTTDDIMQRVSIAAIQNPPVGQQFVISGLYAYSYVPSYNSLNLVKTMLAGLDLQHSIDIAKAVLQRIVTEYGYDDVYPEKIYETVLESIAEVSQHDNSQGYAKVNWRAMIGKPMQLGLRVAGMLQPELSGLATRTSNLLKSKGFAAAYILPPRDLTRDGDVEANPGPTWRDFFRTCCYGSASSTLDRPVTLARRQRTFSEADEPQKTVISSHIAENAETFNCQPAMTQHENKNPDESIASIIETVTARQHYEDPDWTPDDMTPPYIVQEKVETSPVVPEPETPEKQEPSEEEPNNSPPVEVIDGKQQESEISELDLLSKVTLSPVQSSVEQQPNDIPVDQLDVKLSTSSSAKTYKKPRHKVVMHLNNGSRIECPRDSVLYNMLKPKHSRHKDCTSEASVSVSSISVTESVDEQQNLTEPDVSFSVDQSDTNLNIGSYLDPVDDCEDAVMPILPNKKATYGLRQHYLQSKKSSNSSMEAGKASTNLNTARKLNKAHLAVQKTTSEAVEVDMEESDRLTLNVSTYAKRSFIIIGKETMGEVVDLECTFGYSAPTQSDFTLEEAGYKIKFQGFDKAKLIAELGKNNLEILVVSLIKTLFLNGVSPTTKSVLNIKANASVPVYGISWMFAFFSCVTGFTKKLVYTGGYVFDNGFQTWGEMDSATVLAKYLGYQQNEISREMPRDLAILCLNSGDSQLWTDLGTGYQQIAGTEFPQDAIHQLEYYEYQPHKRKILIPANPFDLYFCKSKFDTDLTDDQIEQVYTSVVGKLKGYKQNTVAVGLYKTLVINKGKKSAYGLAQDLASVVPLPFAQRVLPLVKKYFVGRAPLDYVTSPDLTYLRKNAPQFVKDFLDAAYKKGIHNKNMKLSYHMLIDGGTVGEKDYPVGLSDILEANKEILAPKKQKAERANSQPPPTLRGGKEPKKSTINEAPDSDSNTSSEVEMEEEVFGDPSDTKPTYQKTKVKKASASKKPQVQTQEEEPDDDESLTVSQYHSKPKEKKEKEKSKSSSSVLEKLQVAFAKSQKK